MAENVHQLSKCQKCGGIAWMQKLTVNTEQRWRVECDGCKRVTMHYGQPALAVKDWNNQQREAREPRFIGEG